MKRKRENRKNKRNAKERTGITYGNTKERQELQMETHKWNRKNKRNAKERTGIINGTTKERQEFRAEAPIRGYNNFF